MKVVMQAFLFLVFLLGVNTPTCDDDPLVSVTTGVSRNQQLNTTFFYGRPRSSKRGTQNLSADTVRRRCSDRSKCRPARYR